MRPYGERHPKAKLTDDDVRLICELRRLYGLSYRTIGDKFECSRFTIRNIVRGITRAKVIGTV